MIRRRSRLLASLTLALLAPACATRVTLPLAPPPTAPLAERTAYYRAWRPTTAFGTTTYVNYTFQGPTPVATRWDQLVLANGTVVEDPRDLSAILPGSPTAAAAEAAARNQAIASGLIGGGIGASALGAVLMLVPFFSPDSSFSGDGLPTVFWVGAGLGLVGSIATIIGRSGFISSANNARAAAFGSYDGALRTRLNLCETGGLALDCDAPAPAPPPAPPAAWAPPPPATPPPPPPAGAWPVGASR